MKQVKKEKKKRYNLNGLVGMKMELQVTLFGKDRKKDFA